MKYFEKTALLGFAGKEEKIINPSSYSVYQKNVATLPTIALRKRLNKLQLSAQAYKAGAMPEHVLSDYQGKVDPLVKELGKRGYKFETISETK